jgi:glycosyltransferase involved in cell wall biosynthesis
MRILAYSHNFVREGAPIILLRLLRELRQRHEIDILRLKRPGPEPLEAEFEEAGIALKEGVHLRHYDVCLFNTVTASGILMQTAGRCPVLWWIHEPKFGLGYTKMPDFKPEAFAAAERIVFPTLWQARWLWGRYLSRDNWTVVPYGIGMDLSPRPCPFDKKPGRFYLLHLGRIDPRKGQDLSVRALAHLGNPDITLVLVGNRKENDPYVAKLDAAGVDILYTGSLPEPQVAAYIQHCDAMVFPTRDDLITLAILEGLSFSKCVLASDFGPIPETIVQGRTGLLSPVNDYRVLAGNIRMIYEDRELMARLGQGGNDILQRKHSFKGHVEAMERELEAAALGRGKTATP